MGFLLRAAAVASGSCAAAGAYFFVTKRNQKQHGQDVPEGGSCAVLYLEKM
jgi:hypothetical protein